MLPDMNTVTLQELNRFRMASARWRSRSSTPQPTLRLLASRETQYEVNGLQVAENWRCHQRCHPLRPGAENSREQQGDYAALPQLLQNCLVNTILVERTVEGFRKAWIGY
jgi:hypothetical protein